MVDERGNTRLGVAIPDKPATTGEIGVLSKLSTSLNATYRMLTGSKTSLDPASTIPQRVSLLDVPQKPSIVHDSLQRAWNKERKDVTISEDEWSQRAAKATLALMYAHRETVSDALVLQAAFKGWGIDISGVADAKGMLAQKEAVAKAYRENFLQQFGGVHAESGIAHLANRYIDGICSLQNVLPEALGNMSIDQALHIADDLARGKELLSQFLQRLFGDELLAQGFSMAVDAQFSAMARNHMSDNLAVGTLSQKEQEVLTLVGEYLPQPSYPIDDPATTYPVPGDTNADVQPGHIKQKGDSPEQLPDLDSAAIELGLSSDVAHYLQFGRTFVHLIHELHESGNRHELRMDYIASQLGFKSLFPWLSRRIQEAVATPSDRAVVNKSLRWLYVHERLLEDKELNVDDMPVLEVKAMQETRGCLMDDLKLLGSEYRRIVGGETTSGQLGSPWSTEAVDNVVDEVARLVAQHGIQVKDTFSDHRADIQKAFGQQVSLAGQIYEAYHMLPIRQLVEEVKMRASTRHDYRQIRRELLGILFDFSQLEAIDPDESDKRRVGVASRLGIDPDVLNNKLGNMRGVAIDVKDRQLQEVFENSAFAYRPGVTLEGGIAQLDIHAREEVRDELRSLLQKCQIPIPAWLADVTVSHLSKVQVREMIMQRLYYSSMPGGDILSRGEAYINSLPTRDDQIEGFLELFADLAENQGRRSKPESGPENEEAIGQLDEWLNDASPLLPPAASGVNKPGIGFTDPKWMQ